MRAINPILRPIPFILVVGLLITGLGLLAGLRSQGVEDNRAEPGSAVTSSPRTMKIESLAAQFRPESINFREVEVVALGTVVETLPSRWITADGKLPAEFKGREESTFGANIDLATPVVLRVKEYWKNPQATDVLMVRSLGGRDGDFEISYSHATLQKFVGQDVLALLQAPQPYADLGVAWRETWIVPIYDGKVAQQCGKANLSDCLLPVGELKTQMLAALAAGTPYRISQ